MSNFVKCQTCPRYIFPLKALPLLPALLTYFYDNDTVQLTHSPLWERSQDQLLVSAMPCIESFVRICPVEASAVCTRLGLVKIFERTCINCKTFLKIFITRFIKEFNQQLQRDKNEANGKLANGSKGNLRLMNRLLLLLRKGTI